MRFDANQPGWKAPAEGIDLQFIEMSTAPPQHHLSLSSLLCLFPPPLRSFCSLFKLDGRIPLPAASRSGCRRLLCLSSPARGAEKTLHGKVGLLAWLYKLFLESHSELHILCYGHSLSFQFHLRRGFTFICMQ